MLNCTSSYKLTKKKVKVTKFRSSKYDQHLEQGNHNAIHDHVATYRQNLILILKTKNLWQVFMSWIHFGKYLIYLPLFIACILKV